MTHFADNTALKQFAYDKRKQDPGRTVSNYSGWQSTDLKAGEADAVDNLVENLNSEIAQCGKQVGIGEVTLYNIWININPPGSYNHLHNHVGAVFSGVYYVDACPEQGNIQFERTDGGEYHLPVNIEKETYYTSTRATYAAKTGGLYVFPGWLKHSVQGNLSDQDRISISFNYGSKV
jgi:uncharacterized protein (TIGR02466 family)